MAAEMKARGSEWKSPEGVQYANCWEDADILLEALSVKKGGSYLSIASSGDNTFSMLGEDPGLVLAVDVNPAQLACVDLRRAAFRALHYRELLAFLGVFESSRRRAVYRDLRDLLCPQYRRYWDDRQAAVEQGIIHMGKFEGYFRLFRHFVLPLIHGRKRIGRLFEPKSQEENVRFYREEWNSRRWRAMFRVFFSRFVLGRLGRDPACFRYVEGPVAGRLMEIAARGLTTTPADNNPYLRYICTGTFAGSLPHYLREENYHAIRQNLKALNLFEGTITEALESHSSLKFDGCNLSDIFEYMSIYEYKRVLASIAGRTKEGGRLVYWNMLAARNSEPSPDSPVKPLDEVAEELFRRNRAFFYKALVVEEVV